MNYFHLNNDNFWSTYNNYNVISKSAKVEDIEEEIKELERLIENKKALINTLNDASYHKRGMLGFVLEGEQLTKRINLLKSSTGHEDKLSFYENLLKENIKYNINLTDVIKDSGLHF